MNKVTTIQLPQKGLLFIRTSNALQLLYFNIQLFAFNNIPTNIFTEKARKSRCQEVGQSSRVLEFSSYVTHLSIHLFLHFSIFTFSPFLLCSVFTDERMFYMLAKFEAIITKSYILAVYTFVHSLICINFSQFTAITVVIIFFASYLFSYLLFFDFIFFLFDLSHNLWRFLISTKRTFYNSIVFNFMLSPLHKTFQVKGIPADSSTRGSGITFDDLGVANCAEIVFLLVLLLNDDIASRDLYFDVFQKISYFVLMNTTVCDNISKFFVIIGMPEEQRIVVWYVKNLCENIERVKTLFVIVVEAGALELVPNRDLEFGAMNIFENEAGPACDTYEIKFRDKQELMFDLFDFKQVILLFRLRHHTINIIRQAIIFYSYFKIQQKPNIKLYADQKESIHHFLALLC